MGKSPGIIGLVDVGHSIQEHAKMSQVKTWAVLQRCDPLHRGRSSPRRSFRGTSRFVHVASTFSDDTY